MAVAAKPTKPVKEKTAATFTVSAGVVCMTLALVSGAVVERFRTTIVSQHLIWLSPALWTIGMLLVIAGTCAVPESRRQPWRMVVAAVGAVAVVVAVILTYSTKAGSSNDAYASKWRNAVQIAGIGLIMLALTVDVTEREATTAMLGLLSLVLGGYVIKTALKSRAQVPAWTLALAAAVAVGFGVSAIGKLAFVGNVRELEIQNQNQNEN